MLTAMTGAGAIIGSLLYARAGLWERDPRIAALMASLAGFATFCFGLAAAFWASLICAALLGFAVTGAGVSIQTSIQTRGEEGYRGRITAIWAAANFGGTAIGGLILGAFSQVADLQQTAVVSGAVLLAAAGYFYRRINRVYAHETQANAAACESPPA